VFKKAKSNLVPIDRYWQFSIPIPAANIKAEYLNHLQDEARKIIFKTSETRDGKPAFTLYKEEYATHYFKNCYRADVVIDVSEDLVWRDAKRLKVNKDRIHYQFPITVPGLESIDPLNDDRYLIRHGSKDILDTRDLHSMAFGADEITAWFELAVSLARETVLVDKHERISVRASSLLKYADANFAAVPPDTLVVKAMSGGVTYPYTKILNLLRILQDGKMDDSKVDKTAESYVKSMELLQIIYGDVQALGFPINYDGDYTLLLQDLRKGTARLPARQTDILDLSMRAHLPCMVRDDFVKQFSLFILANQIDRILYKR